MKGPACMPRFGYRQTILSKSDDTQTAYLLNFKAPRTPESCILREGDQRLDKVSSANRVARRVAYLSPCCRYIGGRNHSRDLCLKNRAEDGIPLPIRFLLHSREPDWLCAVSYAVH